MSTDCVTMWDILASQCHTMGFVTLKYIFPFDVGTKYHDFFGKSVLFCSQVIYTVCLKCYSVCRFVGGGQPVRLIYLIHFGPESGRL